MRNAFTALASLLLIFYIICAVFVIRYRSTKLIKASSVSFLLSMLFGCALASIIVMIGTPYPVSGLACRSQVMLGLVAFDFIFVGQVLRQYRIWAIFSRRRLKVLRLRDSTLIIALSILVMIKIIYFGIWTRIDPIRSVRATDLVTEFFQCQSDHASWSAIAVAFCAVCLAVGTVLATLNRSAPENFADVKSTAVTLYNATVLGSIFVAGFYAIAKNEQQQRIFLNLGLTLIPLVCVAVMLIPKIRTIAIAVDPASATESEISGSQLESVEGLLRSQALLIEYLENRLVKVDSTYAKGDAYKTLKVVGCSHSLSDSDSFDQSRPNISGLGHSKQNNSGLQVSRQPLQPIATAPVLRNVNSPSVTPLPGSARKHSIHSTNSAAYTVPDAVSLPSPAQPVNWS